MVIYLHNAKKTMLKRLWYYLLATILLTKGLQVSGAYRVSNWESKDLWQKGDDATKLETLKNTVEKIKTCGVDLVDPEGNTLLHKAATYGDTNTPGYSDSIVINAVTYLLKRGADPNKQNDFGQTPLHELIDGIQNENYRITTAKQIIDLLVAHKADLTKKDNNGRTPLAFAEDCKKSIVKKSRHEEIIKYLETKLPPPKNKKKQPNNTGGKVVSSNNQLQGNSNSQAATNQSSTNPPGGNTSSQRATGNATRIDTTHQTDKVTKQKKQGTPPPTQTDQNNNQQQKNLLTKKNIGIALFVGVICFLSIAYGYSLGTKEKKKNVPTKSKKDS